MHLEGTYFAKKANKDIECKTVYRSVSSDFVDIISERIIESIDRHDLWPPIVSKNNMQTWIYNNAKGEIVLFIAPVYPFNFCSKRVKEYMPYFEWITEYKPFIKCIIPKKRSNNG